jgi:hypothetical protein
MLHYCFSTIETVRLFIVTIVTTRDFASEDAMKWIVSVITTAVSLTNIAAAQNDSAAWYHPLQSGNEWIYQKAYSSWQYPQPIKTTMSVLSRKVVDDSILNNIRYVVIEENDHKTNQLTRFLERYDTLSGIFSRLNSNVSDVLDSVYVTTPNKMFSENRMKFINTVDDTILGIPTNTRTTQENAVGVIVQWKFTHGIGTTKEIRSDVDFFGGSGVTNTIIYAKINGKEYGTNPKKPLLDSLARYYPLQTGNMWVYNMAGNANFKIKKVLGDSTLNNKAYKVVETSYLPAATTGRRPERVDTAAGKVYGWFGDRELMLDNMLIPPNGKFDYRQFDSVTTGTVFNTASSIRHVQELLFPMNPHYRYAYGFGEIYSDFTYENDIPPYPAIVRYNLVFAKIDGKEFGVNPLSIEELPVIVPEEFLLSQNYPNPFNPATVINYRLPTKNLVTIKIYDLPGREVAVLVNEVQDAGTYSVQFLASALASGIYIYHLQAGNFGSTKKMTLIK